MKITLIRHGMTAGNYKKRYIGSTDEPLHDTLSINLDYPQCGAVFSSPMKRCIETARFIYPEHEITICNDLRECDFGDFENKSYDELKEDPYYKRWLESGGKIPFPRGEAHENFKKRCISAFYDALKAKPASAAFVIHGGTVMAVMQELFGGGFYDYMLRNGGMFSFEYDEGRAYSYIKKE